MTTSSRRLINLSILLALASTLPILSFLFPESAAAVSSRGDPANVAGNWDYRTRSNCGTVEGVGAVSFVWDAETSTYRENGYVYWSDSGSTIRWWGSDRYDASNRTLIGRVSNTLGDTVDHTWELEGPGPDRAVVRWNQTNGCRGEGIATRASN